jgi:phage shock protein A
MGDVGMAIERAEDKTAQMQARAGAVDELIASGALNDPLSSGSDDITAELNRVSSGNDIELELAKMKAQIGPSGEAPAQLEGTPAAAKEEPA